ncbi:MAG: response regulator [Verrucomicrobiales bacterium]|nr:response regulator [Verrucomicrobiales bacterium]
MGLNSSPLWGERNGAAPGDETPPGHATLPVVAEPAVLPGGNRVLVVDDDVIDRELTTRCLRKAWPGAKPLVLDSAEGGLEAVRLLRKERYALLILDWNMPGHDGAGVINDLLQLEIRIPVVVLSGEWREDIRLDWAQLGAAYLSKNSLTPELFRQVIVEVMRTAATSSCSARR